MGYLALKAVYNRKTKGYDVQAVENADIGMIHHGYLVVDPTNIGYALSELNAGRLIASWKKEKQTAIKEWLDRKWLESKA